MRLGDVVLPAICIEAFDPGEDTVEYATHAVIQGKPKKQLVAEGSRVPSLTLFLHREFIDPAAVEDTLRSIQHDGEVVTLQHDGGKMLGSYVITGVRPIPVWTTADGTVMCQRLQVTFDDPALEPTVVPSPAPIAITSSAALLATTDAGPVEDTSRDPDAVTTLEIARA